MSGHLHRVPKYVKKEHWVPNCVKPEHRNLKFRFFFQVKKRSEFEEKEEGKDIKL